jgi:hypothetical protein
VTNQKPTLSTTTKNVPRNDYAGSTRAFTTNTDGISTDTKYSILHSQQCQCQNYNSVPLPHHCHVVAPAVNAAPKSSLASPESNPPKRSCAVGARSDTLEWDGFGTDASSSAASSSSKTSPWEQMESGNVQPSTFAESTPSMEGYKVMTSPDRVQSTHSVEGSTATAAHNNHSYGGDHYHAVIDNSASLVGTEGPDVGNYEVINDGDDYLSIATR